MYKALTVVTTADFTDLEIGDVYKKRMKSMSSQKPEAATLFTTDVAKVLNLLDSINPFMALIKSKCLLNFDYFVLFSLAGGGLL